MILGIRLLGGSRASPAARPALLAAVLGLACSGPSQAGLVNAPGPNRAWTPDDLGHDAIANGPESCPPNGKKESDPLPNRATKCPETGTGATPAKGPSKAKPK
jgi:hypothetical protein